MREILFIHSVCAMGGVETFFIRLSRELLKRNIKSNFLFLYKKNTDQHLYDQLAFSSNVFFWSDISLNFSKSEKFNLFSPLKKNKINQIFNSVSAIHVDTSVTFFCAKRVISCLSADLQLMFGVYHANEISWGDNKQLPLYESYFRNKIFLDKILFLFFNAFSSDVTKKRNSIDVLNEMIFPLGVDLPDFNGNKYIAQVTNKIKIVSVGRLVSFKAYNVYMLDVIRLLVNQGVSVEYDVYGDGPLKESLVSYVAENNLSENIKYKGELEYSKLDKTLTDYDIFIGSGTALLHAAANGLPCIIAIENEQKPITYGFFSDLPGIDYHEQNLPFERVEVSSLILKFIAMDELDRTKLKMAHNLKSKTFGIDGCADSFVTAIESAPLINGSRWQLYKFLFYFIFCEAFSKLFGGFRYSQKYDQKL